VGDIVGIIMGVVMEILFLLTIAMLVLGLFSSSKDE
jgi:hypothetical protein